MSGAPAKPVAEPDPQSEPYWQAAAQGRLRLQRCEGCGAVRHYPQLLCPHCYASEVAWIDASGRGTVHSWTVAHHAFHPAFREDLPYILVTVDLAEGPRALGRLDPGSQGRLCIGLPVEVAFETIPEGLALPVFRHRDS